jgi:hypothetical protein
MPKGGAPARSSRERRTKARTVPQGINGGASTDSVPHGCQAAENAELSDLVRVMEG